MLTWIGAGAATLGVAATAVLVRHRRRRTRLYAELARARARVLAAQPALLRDDLALQAQAAEFARERIAVVREVLTPQGLALLREEALANLPLVERSYVPLHKQGGTLSYETLHRHGPRCLGVFHSPAMRAAISALVGAPVSPTADHDQSSCSVLCYTEAGDHIDWHYDHNFYRGRHFTTLISLVNESPTGGPSRSDLVYRDSHGGEHTVPFPPNTMVVFEGARVRHKVTRLGPGERRLVLSMTYATDPRIAPGRELLRRVKETAFYGLRALWD